MSEAIPALHFSPDAQELFDLWRGELENRLRSEELSDKPAFESHLSKYRSLMPSLALLFHLVAVVDGQASGAVTLEAAKLAAMWCEYLEQHALKVYAAEVNAHLIAAQALISKIEEGKVQDGVTVRELYRLGWEGLNSKEAVMMALETLEEYQWLRIEEASTGGRPTLKLRLHPELRGAS